MASPSATMVSASTVVAFTSPEMGPSTMVAISARIAKSRPSLAIRLGWVVTPLNIMPHLIAQLPTDHIYIRSINKKLHDFASFYVAFYLSFALYHNIL